MSCVEQSNPALHLTTSSSLKQALGPQGTSWWHPTNHALSPAPSLTIAIAHLLDIDFVGVTEFYHQSVCMMNTLRGRDANMTRNGCACTDDAGQRSPHARQLGKAVARDDDGHFHITHDVIAHDGLSFGGSIADDPIRRLTRLDAQFHHVALLRFLCDVRAFEWRLDGPKLMCANEIRLAEEMAKRAGREVKR